jgi:hypothetical protein
MIVKHSEIEKQSLGGTAPVLFYSALFILLLLSSCHEPEKTSRVSSSGGITLSQQAYSQRPHTIADSEARTILKNYRPHASYRELSIQYPLDNSLFPPEIAAPLFNWAEKEDDVDSWILMVSFEGSHNPAYAVCSQPHWTPAKDLWESMKRNSVRSPVRITILGIRWNSMPQIVSKGTTQISTSRDPVGAPIMFRRIPPIFSYASVHPELLEWCLADISSYDAPPVIMAKQQVCSSCHTFSRDGRFLGMDMDYKGDKGAYFLTEIRETILLADRNFLSWNDFPRNDGLPSSGLFSRLSPNGKQIASTIDDISFLAKMNDPYCSQLFFPIQGSLAYYSTRNRKIARLFTGSDRPETVETDPSWSPDGNYILFSCTTPTHDLFRELGGKTVFSAGNSSIEQLNEEYPVRFDVYRVPFNSGRGGCAEPMPGASRNGRSNYFARYSPDGKWIVFTQSKTGLVLQPDSRLYIMSAGGGKPRMLRCNRSRVNSWHTWSPNGRWLAFVSKNDTPYTELYLTHIDANGKDSIPIVLSRLNKPGYAINVPEFANIDPHCIHKIALQSN